MAAKQVVSRACFRLEYDQDPRGDQKSYGRYIEVRIASHLILENGLPVPHRSGFRRGEICLVMRSEREPWTTKDLLDTACKLKLIFPSRSARRIHDLEMDRLPSFWFSSPLEICDEFRAVCLEQIKILLTRALPRPRVILRPTLERSVTWRIGDDGIPVSDFEAYFQNSLRDLLERQPEWLVGSRRSYFAFLEELVKRLPPTIEAWLRKMGCQRISEVLVCYPAEFQRAGFTRKDFRIMFREYLTSFHPSQQLINALSDERCWEQD